MSAILRRIRKTSLSSSAGKHEKLLEDAGPGEVHPVLEGVTFKVKYLGQCPVTSDSGEEVMANAIKVILATAKSLEKKLPRVEVGVSLAGVTVREQEALQCTLDLPIDRISYCSSDPTYDHVFALLCVEGEVVTCHAFLTPKRKMAQAATITIAQAFNLAYELWRTETTGGSRPLSRAPPPPPSMGVTRAVTRAVVEPQPPPNSLAISSPLLDFSPKMPACSRSLLEELNSVSLWKDREEEEEEEEGRVERRRPRIGHSNSWVQFGEEEEDEQNRSRFEMPRSALPLLSGAPSYLPSSLVPSYPPSLPSMVPSFPPSSPSPVPSFPPSQLADLSCSPSSSSGWASPLGNTPSQGSRLTPSQLASPMGSPFSPIGSLDTKYGSPLPSNLQLPPSPTLLRWDKTQVSSPPRGSSNLCHLSWPSSN